MAVIIQLIDISVLCSLQLINSKDISQCHLYFKQVHTHHVKRDKKKINLHVLNTDSNLNSLKDGLQPAKGKQLRFGVQQAIVQALFLDYKNMQNKGGKKNPKPILSYSQF